MLLVEKDLRKHLLKKGLPQELADWAHSINDKYSGFVANVAFFQNTEYLTNKDNYIASQTYTRLVPTITRIINSLFREQEKPALPIPPNNLNREQAEELLTQLDLMRDWFNNPTRDDKADPKKLSWADALQKATEYHDDQARKAGSRALDVKDDQKVIISYPDGYYWLQLNASSCREEADAMGHCGNAGAGELFSLRDRTGYPYITAAIDVGDESSEQIYGRANTTPQEKYHKRILDLLGKLNIQRVGIKNYGQSSLDVDDIDDELKEWFEGEFGYYPTNTATSEKEIDEAEETINEINNGLTYTSIYVDFTSGEEYANAYYSMAIDISMYDINPNIGDDIIQYGTFKIDLGDIQDYFPGDNATIELQGDNITFHGDLGYYHLDEHKGYDNSSGYGSDESPAKWVQGFDVESYDKKVSSYLAELFEILYDKKVIMKRPPMIDIMQYEDANSKTHFTFEESDGTVFLTIVIPETKANGKSTIVGKSDDYRTNLAERLNNIAAIDTYYIRRGGEYATQLSFKDFFNDQHKDEDEDWKKSMCFQVSFPDSHRFMISTGQIHTLSYEDQSKIHDAMKLIDRTWDGFLNYCASLIGLNGEERQTSTIKYAERIYGEIYK